MGGWVTSTRISFGRCEPLDMQVHLWLPLLKCQLWLNVNAIYIKIYLKSLNNVLKYRRVAIEPRRPWDINGPLGGRGKTLSVNMTWRIRQFNDAQPAAARVVPARWLQCASVFPDITCTHGLDFQCPVITDYNTRVAPCRYYSENNDQDLPHHESLRSLKPLSS